MKTDENVSFPPSNLTELRRIPPLLRQGSLELGISEKMLSALCTLLDHPIQAASESITELSKICGVSAASLSRLARLLGYTHFNQFQAVFQHQERSSTRFYSRSGDALFQRAQQQSAETLSSERLQQQLSQLHRVAELNTDQQILTAAKRLHAARRIGVFARRQSYGLAVTLGYMLGLLRQQVSVVGAAGEGQAQTLNDFGAADLLILIGSHPYSRETAVLASLAHQFRVPTLAITDSFDSPLAQHATQALYAPSDASLFSNSHVAAQYLLESLLIQVAQLSGSNALKRLERREEIISRLEDEY